MSKLYSGVSKGMDDETSLLCSKVAERSIEYSGNLVNAKVVSVLPKDVVVTLGGKSDGVVPRSELKDIQNLMVGTEFELFIVKNEDKNGQILVSHKKAKYVRAWMSIRDSELNKTILQGMVVSKTDGGLIVDIDGISCFLPGSHIDTKQVTNFDPYIGTLIDVIVTKINGFNNILLSHKMIIEMSIDEQVRSLMSQIKEGQILEGEVSNIMSYGAFVNLGGINGLLHITDISWDQVTDINSVLHIGQVLKVVVLECDLEERRISLGMKQLTPGPWEKIPQNVKEGTIVHGKVTNVVDYGVFVEVFEHVDGLVHISEVAWGTKPNKLSEVYKIGDEVDVKVLEINPKEKKISLSIKQVTPDPWSCEGIDEKYMVGNVCDGTVSSIMNYGYVIKFSDGIDGILHISDCSWFNHSLRAPEFGIAVGDKLKVKVLAFQKSECRLYLGVKQLTDNPWVAHKDDFKIGSVHHGVVCRCTSRGCVVKFEEGFEGFLEKEYNPENVTLNNGSEIDCKILDFNIGTERIALASTSTDIRKVREEKYGNVVKPTKVKTKITLGDLIDSALLNEKDGK